EVNHIARWDGSAWHPLADGTEAGTSSVDGSVKSLTFIGTDLYVGGRFPTASGVFVNNVARWDGSGWSPLGGGLGDPSDTSVTVGALIASGGDLYAGGLFDIADGMDANGIARWRDERWEPLGITRVKSAVVDAIAANGS